MFLIAYILSVNYLQVFNLTIHILSFELNSANALVRFDVDFLLDENGNASYWKLVEAAAQAFHIASVEHISLFHISPSSSTSMQEVSSDLDLYRQLATATARSDMSLHAKVHIFRVIDSTVLVGKQGTYAHH